MRGDIRAEKLAAIRADRLARGGAPGVGVAELAERDAAASSCMAGIDPRIAYASMMRAGHVMHDPEEWRR